MLALSFIFAQIFFSLTGVVSGRSYQILFLAFTFARLGQFLNDSLSGVRAFQSNMTGVLLAVLSLTQLFGFGYLAFFQSLTMIADALIGAAVFSLDKKNHFQKALGGLIQGLESVHSVRAKIGYSRDAQEDEDCDYVRL